MCRLFVSLRPEKLLPPILAALLLLCVVEIAEFRPPLCFFLRFRLTFVTRRPVHTKFDRRKMPLEIGLPLPQGGSLTTPCLNSDEAPKPSTAGISHKSKPALKKIRVESSTALSPSWIVFTHTMKTRFHNVGPTAVSGDRSRFKYFNYCSRRPHELLRRRHVKNLTPSGPYHTHPFFVCVVREHVVLHQNVFLQCSQLRAGKF